MKKTLCAGAVALAIAGLLPNFAAAAPGESAALAAQAMASIDIGRIRSVLRLTPAQERYWGPVEAALRDLARRKTQDEPTGIVRRISHRVVSVVLDSDAIRRLAVAARPLIAALDDDQKRAAAGLAQEMGFGSVVAALN